MEAAATDAVGDLPLDAAPDWVRGGGLLAYPTETVWGLGADARSDAALKRLRAFKGRAADAPVSILVSGPSALATLGFRLAGAARKLAADFWPGPLTLVLPCAGRFAAGVARADGAVGVRCSSHPLACALARRCEDAGVGPLTATSCNRSGAPAARTRDEARAVCAASAAGGGARCLADGADPAPGPTGRDDATGSTVVDLTGARPAVLRWGAVPSRVLSPVLEEDARA